VQFRWFYHLQINDRLRFEPGLTFSHASNGKARNPNLGLNVVSLTAGINYLISSKQKPEIRSVDSSTRARSKNELVISAAIGFNERNISTPELRSYLFSVAYNRNVRNTHKFSAGCDLFYDDNYVLDYKEMLQSDPKGINNLRIGAKVGYSYNVGNVSLPVEMGYYVFQKVNPDAIIYTRLGVRYYHPSGFIASFGLRTHFAVAYTFEYGVGYRLNFRK
jgi:hypothetical protein